MPHEISPGSFRSSPTRPTIVIFSMTMSLTCDSLFFVCSRSGNATLSNKFIEQRAVLEKDPEQLPDFVQPRLLAPNQIGVMNDDRALFGLQQSDQTLQGYRLAGARWNLDSGSHRVPPLWRGTRHGPVRSAGTIARRTGGILTENSSTQSSKMAPSDARRARDRT